MRKNIIISLGLILVTVAKTNAQGSGVPDTLAYLQSIVANKTHFVGQPFSKLFDSLQIQIKFFNPFAGIHHDKNKETSSSFAFYFPQTPDEIYLTYPSLEIYWQPYLNASQSDTLYSQNNGGGWSTAVYNFYKNAIIADIQVRE